MFIYAISMKDSKQWGCPHCGSKEFCGSAKSNGSHPVSCMECKKLFVILEDGVTQSSVGYGNPIVYPTLTKHPRMLS